MRKVMASLMVSATLAMPAGARGAVECGVVGSELQVRATAFADGVAIGRDGRAISVSDDRAGLPVTCAGASPTVRTVDTIGFATDQEETFLYLDLAAGRLGPGLTPEPERTSEIEVAVEWPSGFIGVGGRHGDDAYSFGSDRATTFGYLSSDPDPELTVPDAINVLVRGEAGDDDITASGPREDDGSDVFELRAPAIFDGGPGSDLLSGGRAPDVLDGGPGDDRVFPGRGSDTVDCGAGTDRVIGAERTDEVRRCERWR